MFIANKDFTKYLCIEGKNTDISDVKVKEISDFGKKIGTKYRTVEIYFKENIIETSNGLSNQVSMYEDDFYKWFDYEVVTYCYMGNDDNSDFDPDCCEDGDLLFRVPLTWLMEKMNEDSCCRAKSEKINNLTDFLEWTLTYTHEEGYHLYMAASSEDIIIGDTVLTHCNYCKSKQTL